MQPKIIQNYNQNNLNYFSNELLFGLISNIKTIFRIIPLKNISIREFESSVIEGTFLNFFDWISNPSKVIIGHPFYNLPKYNDNIISIYANYKYIHELFSCVSDELRNNLLNLHQNDVNQDNFNQNDVNQNQDNNRNNNWNQNWNESDNNLISFNGSKLYLRNSDLYNTTSSSTSSLSSSSPLPTLSPSSIQLKQHKFHEILDWKDLDESVLSADNATIWVGSKGAHTPLHYDSYGRNVIVQLYGTKSWSLWNPSELNMSILSPSRVPYEESSIYADVTKFDPQLLSDLQRHPPNMKLTLTPGDVLYLPKYWWHYVTTVSFSFSINFFFFTLLFLN